MSDPTTEAIPETHDAPSLLEHITAKVSEFETWAKNALAHATEHTHAVPLGRLLGTLAATAKEIENLKSTGVMFALQAPLEEWLVNVLDHAHEKADAFAATLLDSVTSALHASLSQHASSLEGRVLAVLDDHAAKVQSALANAAQLQPAAPAFTGSRMLPPDHVAGVDASPEAPPSAEQLETLDAEPSFPTLAEFLAQGFYADTYDFRKAEWLKLHQPATTTQESPAENAPSDPATGASSETA